MTRLTACVFLLAAALATDVLAAPVNTLTPAEKKQGWKLLFDGKSTAGWTPRAPSPPPPPPPGTGGALVAAAAVPAPGAGKWAVDKGELLPVKDSGRGHLLTDTVYGDFVLRLDFWIDDKSNSGVFFRTPDSGGATQGNSFEVNLFDGHKEWPTGSINGVQRTSATPQTTGKWNACEITAKGDQLTVVLNGEKVVDVKSSRLPRGNIGFQHPGGDGVKFRNVRIKPM